jgi:hypothetical protein
MRASRLERIEGAYRNHAKHFELLQISLLPSHVLSLPALSTLTTSPILYQSSILFFSTLRLWNPSTSNTAAFYLGPQICLTTLQGVPDAPWSRKTNIPCRIPYTRYGERSAEPAVSIPLATNSASSAFDTACYRRSGQGAAQNPSSPFLSTTHDFVLSAKSDC